MAERAASARSTSDSRNSPAPVARYSAPSMRMKRGASNTRVDTGTPRTR